MKRGFPDYFPMECPPDEAIPAEATFFRLVTTNPPEDRDFRSYVEMQPHRRFDDECKACGLSVFTKIEDIQKLRRRVVAYKKVIVARGKVDRDDGVALHTPSRESDSHHTWWLSKGVTVAKKFVIVENVDGE